MYLNRLARNLRAEHHLGQMLVALGISLVCIFLVLLFQFRTISEPLIVMSAIPLSLFGAVMGLVLTGNPFGFTSLMGCIALSGIVVRNSIILIDYINEKRRVGSTLEEAALEAGERRLRPISSRRCSGGWRDSHDSVAFKSMESAGQRACFRIGVFDVLRSAGVPVVFVIVEKRSERGLSKLGPAIAMVVLCLAGTMHARNSATRVVVSRSNPTASKT